MLLKKGDRGNDVKTLQKYLHLYEDGIFGSITEEAVKTFQKSKGLKVDGIVGVATWTALVPFIIKKSKRKITEIIVHCSDTPEGRHHTVEDIRSWHKQNGWSDVGYHYIVYLDGSIHNGRDVDVVGAHCTNHNAHSIGVCYIGGCEGEVKNGKIVPKTDAKGNHIAKDTRTPEQKDSLQYLLRELKRLHPTAWIYGHRDFAAKACPSFDALNEYRNLN